MKRLTSIALALAMLLSLLTISTGAVAPKPNSVVISPQSLMVDGVVKNAQKYNIDGANYFKLRDLAYLLNGTGSQFSVGWDGAARTVTITTGEAYIPVGGELKTDEDMSSSVVASTQTIKINGEPRSDLYVYNIGGANFFKLRDLGTALGFDVDFDAANNAATIVTLNNTGNSVLTSTDIEVKMIIPHKGAYNNYVYLYVSNETPNPIIIPEAASFNGYLGWLWSSTPTEWESYELPAYSSVELCYNSEMSSYNSTRRSNLMYLDDNSTGYVVIEYEGKQYYVAFSTSGIIVFYRGNARGRIYD